MKKILKKLRSSKGFSMSELLVATIILGLMTTAMAAGISGSLRVYNNSVTYSEKRMLLATVSEQVISELRHAKMVTLTNGTALDTYTSNHYGFETKIENKNDMIRVRYKNTNGGYSYSNLVGDGSYSAQKNENGTKSYRLKAKITQDEDGTTEGVKYNSNGCFEAYIRVWSGNSAEDEEKAEVKHIMVRPLDAVETSNAAS